MQSPTPFVRMWAVTFDTLPTKSGHDVSLLRTRDSTIIFRFIVVSRSLLSAKALDERIAKLPSLAK